MDIFENLEELNVSEECFEDIISIVEEIPVDEGFIETHTMGDVRRAARNSEYGRLKSLLKRQRNTK